MGCPAAAELLSPQGGGSPGAGAQLEMTWKS